MYPPELYVRYLSDLHLDHISIEKIEYNIRTVLHQALCQEMLHMHPAQALINFPVSAHTRHSRWSLAGNGH